VSVGDGTARRAAVTGGHRLRRILKRLLGLGLLVGTVYAVGRWLRTQGRERPAVTPPGPWSEDGPSAFHVPSQVVPPGGPETEPAGATWVDPIRGVCPPSHPVKATLSDSRFYLPDDPSSEPVVPDRCYVDADAAREDGLRPTEGPSPDPS
jgi:hypothetical protein